MRYSINQWTLEWALKNKISAHFLDKTESTNTWAKAEFNGPLPSIYLTDYQSCGRGRNSNAWTTANAGDGLLSTWCFSKTVITPYIFSVRVGCALYKALKTTWPQAPFALKAPNDIYIKNKKLAGLLIEVVSQRDNNVFIGLGLNAINSPDTTLFESTALAHNVSIEKTQWNDFCSILFELLSTSVLNNTPLLESFEREEALIGLSSYYGLALSSIEPDGTLLFTDGTKKIWKDL